MHERIVISEADLWRPIEDRSSSLDAENRRGLDWRRARAYWIDRLVLLIPSSVAVGLFGEGTGFLVATALMLAYFFVWESLTGQTAGKRIMGLRVVRANGAPLNLAAVATRNLLLIVDQFVGVLFIVATRRRQRLGDLVAGTVVTAADDHPHVASTERFRTGILVGYPVLWISSALVAVALAAGAQDRQQYLDLANASCASTRVAVLRNPDAGPAEMHRAIADLERSLRAMTVPAAARPGHDRLVRAIHGERRLLGEAERTRGVVARRRVAERYRALAARDAVTARADGYPGCA